MSRFVLLNGPNLGLLGRRQPHLYGTSTLADVETLLRNRLVGTGATLDAFQHDVEGELVAFLGRVFLDHEEHKVKTLGVVFNPGAYTHTSIALRDACEILAQAGISVVEVHLSNVFAREPFRHHSYLSPVAKGVVVGLGAQGYALALEALLSHNGLA
ncbi:MAG: 3-dehydroquinate dehydratase [Silvanigrellales bacterium]|nr:3-dehydroquinate dehydratase [Silvanigrellales bacterium]